MSIQIYLKVLFSCCEARICDKVLFDTVGPAISSKKLRGFWLPLDYSRFDSLLHPRTTTITSIACWTMCTSSQNRKALDIHE